MASKDPLSTESLFEHVQDATYFHVPQMLAPGGHGDGGGHGAGHIDVPQVVRLNEPVWEMRSGNAMLDGMFQPFDLVLTKFMVLELVAAVLVLVFFMLLAARLRWGGPPRGRFWNLLEVMMLFIRDKVARPAIGHEEADKFLPFLYTMFFFVLGCNLLGMVPWLGAPTGALATTGALAFCTFLVVVGAGMARLGPIGFLKAQVPHMDLPGPLGVILVPMIFVLEIFGLLIKHFVLAIRLLANMMAGHIVLAVFLAFIAVTWQSGAVYGVAPLSIVGSILLSILELFVAFLHAYVFVFLSALFIGAAVHPH